MESIGNEIAPGARGNAQSAKGGPMPVARSHGDHAGLGSKGIDSVKRRGGGDGHGEDPRIGHEPDETAQGQLGYADRIAGRQRSLEPIAIAEVVRGAIVKCVDDHVDVEQDQADVPSISSSRAALSSRSTPGCSPPPDRVAKGGGTEAAAAVRRATNVRIASSITSVMVRPDVAAMVLTSIRSRSSMLTVVRTHQSITVHHHDVKQRPSVMNEA